MNDEPCTVEINGQTYYGPCELIDTIVVWTNPNNENDKYLVSTSNENFTLYRNTFSFTNNSGGYPRIVFYPSRWGAYYRDSTVSNPTNLAVTSFHVTHRNIETNTLLLVVLIGVMFMRLFKR